MADTAPLIAEITAAFDGVTREGGVSLREGEVIDSYGSDDERAAARALDTDTCWQDVTDDDLRTNSIAMTYLDAKGLRYYLPAFLIYDLRHNFNSHKSIYVLPYLYPAKDDIMFHRFQLLTSIQGRAICHFLDFTVTHGEINEYDRHDAAQALADYWNRYAEGD